MNWREHWYKSFFPERLVLSEREQALLRGLFPEVNWSEVAVFNGLLWYAQSSFAIAMALPSAWHKRRCDMHFRDYARESPIQRTITLVHEAFHIVQYKDLHSVIDVGYFRRFTRYYFGWYIALWVRFFWKYRSWSRAAQEAYNRHPMEITAYQYEADFAKEYHWFTVLEPAVFIDNYPHLIRKNAGTIEPPPLWAWALGSFLTLLLALIKPLSDVVVGGLARLFYWRGVWDTR